MRRFTNTYAPDGKEKRSKARAEAGHRCLRCHHPYEAGKHGKGEWSPCDEQCTHEGPIRRNFGNNNEPFKEAQWRILTVHHMDGDKSNDAWWNTLSLCQRCHLEIQGKLDPEIPFFLEHSSWIKPFICGFYANKYEGKNITREEAERRMTELLAYEQRA